ncbi:hypothetical protein [Nocardioides sp.]|uniref:hypothetical protein n=1 Tax=Nocardioides sp. TaxID=35761 RepID=UPI002B6F016F|nr:hypothetical protein [Nocardioides sp.]HXH78310.1 hypothetical protein [Nocardioides sp.]
MRMTGLLVLALAAASLAVPHGAPAAGSAPNESGAPLLTFADDPWTNISPNGDGRLDAARFRFELGRRASVAVTIRPAQNGDAKPLQRESLGELEPGRHAWRWDGTRRGRSVADGTYELVFTARRGTRTERVSRYVGVDTDGRGRLLTTRPTVHPLAEAVEDQIALTWVTREWTEHHEEADPGDRQSRSRLSIKDRRGTTVWHTFRKNEYAPHFRWDGRDADGTVLAAGDYVAVLKTVDQAGNLFTDATTLRVSHEQLEQRTWTTTVPAAQTVPYRHASHGCLSCEDFVEPVPSDRFPGGLSYRPAGVSSWGSRTIPLPFPAAPVDTYRVSAFGGPTTPGAPDVGILYGSGGSARTPVGDGTTTVPWGPVGVDDLPFLPSGTQPIGWRFLADYSYELNRHQSYDVASFTVEYRYYAPVG